MIIYCNGDSFVAGTELGDDILPGYPGTMDFTSTAEQRAPFEKWKVTTHDPSRLGPARDANRFLIEKLERERAWPNKLSNLANIDVVNSAEGGSSMDRIARTTVCDLLRLKETSNDITAIIGTTSELRFEVGNKLFWQSILVSSHVTKDIEPLVRFKVEYETDYHAFVNYFKNIIYIQDFCRVNGFKLYFICPKYTYPNDELLQCNPDLSDMVNYADLKYELVMDDIAIRINKNALTPTFHYSEIIHDEVARILYEKLIK
jgi:hypothetical protein